MRCTKCDSVNCYCIDSRDSKESLRYRRYKCEDCGERFSTVELPMPKREYMKYLKDFTRNLELVKKAEEINEIMNRKE